MRLASRPAAAVALVLLSACSGTPADYKEAFVLTEDSSLRCEAILSQVVVYWRVGGSNPESFLDLFYTGAGRIDIEPMEARLTQAREALADVSNRSGQERDLLLDHYTGVEKLCKLAKSPEGYSQITYNERRSALRDEIAGTKAKLNILLPVTEAERATILAKYAAPVQEAERRVKAASGSAALADAKRRQEEAETAARRDAERKAFDAEEARQLAAKEDLHRIQPEGAEVTGRLQQEDAAEQRRQAELLRQSREKERRENLSSTSAPARAWFEQSYEVFDHFCKTAEKFSLDMQASQFSRFQECHVLKESIGFLRGRAKSGTQQISSLATAILDSYDQAANACLKKSVPVFLLSFTRGQKACGQLRLHMREYGFTSN
jgi:hypothetical protein